MIHADIASLGVPLPFSSMDNSGGAENETSGEAERLRSLRRAAQRQRRIHEDNNHRENRRNRDTNARKLSRSLLSDDRAAQIRQEDTEAHARQRESLNDIQRAEIRETNRIAHHIRRHPISPTHNWGDRVAILNTAQTTKPIGLTWNRNCIIAESRFALRSLIDSYLYL